MFKRFLVGFAIGVGAMYYYLYYGDEWVSSTEKWGTDAASNYRDDKNKKAADALLKDH